MKYEVKALVPLVFVVSAESAVLAKNIAVQQLAGQFADPKLLSITLVSPIEGDPSVEAWEPPTAFEGRQA